MRSLTRVAVNSNSQKATTAKHIKKAKICMLGGETNPDHMHTLCFYRQNKISILTNSPSATVPWQQSLALETGSSCSRVQ